MTNTLVQANLEFGLGHCGADFSTLQTHQFGYAHKSCHEVQKIPLAALSKQNRKSAILTLLCNFCTLVISICCILINSSLRFYQTDLKFGL